MAQVTTGFIYECEGHGQEGDELAAEHRAIVVGRQNLIDNQGTRPRQPWPPSPQCDFGRGGAAGRKPDQNPRPYATTRPADGLDVNVMAISNVF